MHGNVILRKDVAPGGGDGAREVAARRKVAMEQELRLRREIYKQKLMQSKIL